MTTATIAARRNFYTTSPRWQELSAWLGQRLCAFSGHHLLPAFEQQRMMLRCAHCGHETPGWSLNGPAPRRVA
jgi:hypothetical protein